MDKYMIELDSLNLPKTITGILDLLDDGIIITDTKGKIVYYNHASEKMDNLKREFVLGRVITECFNLDEKRSITLKVLRTQKSIVDYYQDYITISGTHVTTISSAYPLFNEAELIGALIMTKNITKFKKISAILNRKHDKAHENADVNEMETKYTFDQIVGQSASIKASIKIATKSSETESPILLYGETGTGKELFAQSIHNASLVKGPFCSLNCAAIPENLLEGILFGTARGAFTGSIDRAGLFEEASNGTLFLDELNSMSLNMQAKLLRAIETRKIRRVGEIKERPIKPRIVSALNITPLKAMENGLLRSDLFYRLGVISIKIPSLAERKEDIPLLIQHFINHYNEAFSRKVTGVSPEVLNLFQAYHWPGNVRELEHAVEYAMHFIDQEEMIIKEYLPPIILEQMKDDLKENGSGRIRDDQSKNHTGKDLKTLLEEVEQETISRVLGETGGNISAAAKKLGLNRQSLDYKIKKYRFPNI